MMTFKVVINNTVTIKILTPEHCIYVTVDTVLEWLQRKPLVVHRRLVSEDICTTEVIYYYYYSHNFV